MSERANWQIPMDLCHARAELDGHAAWEADGPSNPWVPRTPAQEEGSCCETEGNGKLFTLRDFMLFSQKRHIFSQTSPKFLFIPFSLTFAIFPSKITPKLRFIPQKRSRFVSPAPFLSPISVPNPVLSHFSSQMSNF